MTAQTVADGQGFTPDRTQRKAWLDIANGIGICLAVLAQVTNEPDTRSDPGSDRRACKLHPLHVPYPVRQVGSRPSLALVRLGQVSLSIYVLQVVAGAGRWTIPLHLGVIENPLAYLLLCTFTGVLLPGGVHELLACLRLFELFGLRSAHQAKFSGGRRPGIQLELRHSQRQG